MLSLHSCAGFSAVMESRGSSLVAVHRFLTAVASLVAAYGLLGHGGSVAAATGLQSTGSVVVTRGLSYSEAHGSLPDQGSNPCLLHGQTDSLPLSHPGSPST